MQWRQQQPSAVRDLSKACLAAQSSDQLCTGHLHHFSVTMSSNDSMGGAALPSASSTTMLSRVRVSCRWSSLSACTRADGCHAAGAAAAAAAASVDGDLAPARTSVGFQAGPYSLMQNGGSQEPVVRRESSRASKEHVHALIYTPCLSSEAELSERLLNPGRSKPLLVPFARALDGLPLPLLSRKCGGT
jgi:hypothetical protein